jgi:Rad51
MGGEGVGVQSALEEGKGAIWLHTEGRVPVERLCEMGGRDTMGAHLVRSCESLASLVEALEVLERKILPGTNTAERAWGEAHGRFSVLVVDSIAAVFRGEGKMDASRRAGAVVRSNALMQVGASLRRIAMRWNLAVLVTNQASAVVAEDSVGGVVGGGGGLSELAALRARGCRIPASDSYNYVQPALGPVWASIINARIALSKPAHAFVPPLSESEGSQSTAASSSSSSSVDHGAVFAATGRAPNRFAADTAFDPHETRRELTLIFHPAAPSGSCPLHIRHSGVSGTRPEA